MPIWAVVHDWNGQKNEARFDDHSKAAEYAARWHGTLIDLRYAECPSDNSKQSQPLCMTDAADFLLPEEILTPKHIR